MNREKLMNMANSNTVRTGGKDTLRRNKKAVNKTNITDDKKLQSTLQRIGVNSIQLLKKLTSSKMMLLFNSSTLGFKLQLLQTLGLLVVLFRPKVCIIDTGSHCFGLSVE